VWRYRQQARVNAMMVNAIAHGSPEFRKILELVQQNPTPAWTPQPIEDRREPTAAHFEGFELVHDTWILDMRDWRPKTNDIAHFYARIRGLVQVARSQGNTFLGGRRRRSGRKW